MPLRMFVLLAVAMAVIFVPLLAGQGNATINAPVLTYKLDGNTVNLSWDSVANATEYKVYNSTDNSTFTLVNTTSKTYYTLTQKWNTTMYYYVIAANATVASAHSNIVKVVTPEQPSSGAGWTNGITMYVYAPFLWLGVFFFVVGLICIGYGKTSRKHRKWEGFGGLLTLLGLVIILAAIFLPTVHLI